MTDSNETIPIGYENLIVQLMEVIDKNQQMLLDMHKILTPLLTPRFDYPSLDEKKDAVKMTAAEKTHVTGILQQVVKDRENLARKTVLIEKLQDLLDAHYGWENENGIDD